MGTLIYLLDTHTSIWAALFPGKLSLKAAGLIGDGSNRLLVSAASAWEISTKVRLGKWPEAALFEANFIEMCTAHDYGLLALEVDVALLSGQLRGTHKDPFDRMIAAQALALNIAVISNDAALDGFGVRRVW